MLPIKKMIRDPDGYLHPWSNGDFHSRYGMIREKNIQSGIIKTNLNYAVQIFEPTFKDRLLRIKKGPATPSPKDIGLIIAHTGIGKDSLVVDAGTGSGVLGAYLSRICKTVTTYEQREDFAKMAKENFKCLSLNPTVKRRDISKGISERNLDLITLDLPEPWHVLKRAEKALKSGAFLVCYLPTITQVQQLVDAAKKYRFFLDKVTESIERHWIVSPPVVRPEHHALTHSAFLVFLRKY